VRGCLSWRHGGLGVPDEVTSATGDYKAEQDVLGDFLDECCIMTPGASATAAELYENYKTWADKNGEKKPFSQKALGLTLTERGFARTRAHGGKTIWKGIGVKGEGW
jgi:putative DNA primase/helicase